MHGDIVLVVEWIEQEGLGQGRAPTGVGNVQVVVRMRRAAAAAEGAPVQGVGGWIMADVPEADGLERVGPRCTACRVVRVVVRVADRGP